MPRVVANGININYGIFGVGQPVLLIMGTGLGYSMWNSQIEAYSKEFQCIAFDNRGTGESDKPGDGYTVPKMAEDAAALLDALDISGAHVMGWSLGSAIAQELALRHPGKVKTLGLHHTWDRPYPHLRRRLEVQIEIARLDDQRLLGAFSALHLFSPQFINEHDDEVTAFQRRALEGPTRATMDVLIGHYTADILHDTAGRLSEIKVPTLITVGSEDQLTRPEYARAVHERIAGSELVLFDGADHMAPITIAEKFNKVTLDFLRRHR